MFHGGVLIFFVSILAAPGRLAVVGGNVCAGENRHQESCAAGNSSLIQDKSTLATLQSSSGLAEDTPGDVLMPSAVGATAGPVYGMVSNLVNYAAGDDSSSAANEGQWTDTSKFSIQLDGTGSTQCDFFYKASKNQSAKQADLRGKNVAEMMQKYPGIRRFDVLFWEGDWDLVKDFYKALGLKVDIQAIMTSDGGPSKAAQGKISHWATLLLAFAWQVRFARPCMALLEDDVKLESNFGETFETFHQIAWQPEVIQLNEPGHQSWGAGWVFNLPAAKRFLHLVAERGIYVANDIFILDNFEVDSQEAPIEILVETGNGNINGSPLAQQEEFSYTKGPSEDCYNQLVGAYADNEVSSTEIDLQQVASRIASPQGSMLLQHARSSARDEPWSLHISSSQMTAFARLVVLILAPAMICMVFYLYGEKGATVALCILAYLGFLTTIQFTVKIVTSECGFKYTAFLTTLHFIASSVVGACLMAYRSISTGEPIVCPTAHEFSFLITPLAVAFALATLLTNTALLYSSIAYVQIIGSTAPIVSAGLSVAMGFPFDMWMFAATCVVVFGCVMSIEGEVELSWIGTACAFSANVLRAVKAVMTQYIMQNEDTKKKFEPCSLLTWMCFASIFLMAAVSAAWEGLAPWHALLGSTTTKLWVAIIVSCLNAAGLNLFSLIVTKDLGAVGQELSGQLKNVLCFFGGIVVFKEVVKLLEILGFAVVLAGVNMYQIFDRRLMKARAAKT